MCWVEASLCTLSGETEGPKNSPPPHPLPLLRIAASRQNEQFRWLNPLNGGLQSTLK